MIDHKKVVAIIQARMGSSRLPGKVLKDLAGKPMLAHVIIRTLLSRIIDEVWVATTTDPSDDPIQVFCVERNVQFYRGDVFDVLDRYYQAAKASKADIVVRITADCPLVDPELIDSLIWAFENLGVDFAANRLPPPFKRSFPIGLDVEVAHFSALEKAWCEAEIPFEREHVMPFLYDQPGRFKTLLMHNEMDYGDKRWTVDTQEDLDMVSRVVEYFGERNDFSWLEVLNWLEQHPEIEQINAEVKHKSLEEIDDRFKKTNTEH